MRYKVIRTCYWNRRLWEEGEEVELTGDVPEHFKPLYSINERLTIGREELAEEQQMQAEPEQAHAAEADASSTVNLDDMNVGQLQKLARENGLTMPKSATKQDLLSALRGE